MPPLATISKGRGGDIEIGWTRHVENGRGGMPEGRHRKPQRESYRRFREPGVLVCGVRVAGTALVQSGKHHGLDGGIQERQISSIRLVRRAHRRCNELDSRPLDVAPSHGVGVPRSRLFRAQEFCDRMAQHAIVPGPNSGWSEAAAAGSIQRKLVGPIWANGRIVTEVWLGDPDDPPAGGEGDFRRSAILITSAGLGAVAIAIAILFPCILVGLRCPQGHKREVRCETGAVPPL